MHISAYTFLYQCITSCRSGCLSLKICKSSHLRPCKENTSLIPCRSVKYLSTCRTTAQRASPRLDVSTCHTTAQRPLPRQCALTSVLQQMPMIIISRGSTGPHTSVPSSSRISNVLTTPTAHKNCWLTPQRHLSWLTQAQNNANTLAFFSFVAQAHRNIA